MTKKGIALALGCAILGSSPALAQTTQLTEPPRSNNEEFNKFRESILNEFSDFKKKILDHYADFLNGEWVDFDPILVPNPQFEMPKPGTAPIYDGGALTGDPIRIDVQINPNALPGLTKAPTAKERQAMQQGGTQGGGNPAAALLGGGGGNPAAALLGGGGGGNPAAALLGGGGGGNPAAALLGSGFGGGSLFGSGSGSLMSPEKKQKSNYELAITGEPDPGFAFGVLPGQEAMPDDEGIGFVEEVFDDVITQTTDRSSVYRVYSSGDKKNSNSKYTKVNKPKKPKDEARENKRRWTWKFWERYIKKQDKDLAQSQAPGQTQPLPPSQTQPKAPAAIEDTEEIPADILADLKAGNVEDFFFDFYDMPMFIPELKFTIAKELNGSDQTGKQWTDLDNQPNAKEAARQLFGLAQNMGLNGYLSYRLAEAYINAKFPDSNLLSRISATHYLLSQMGYDARMWVSRIDDIATIMMPFDQLEVFGLHGRQDSKTGRKCHILPPAGYTIEELANKGLAGCTYNVPEEGGKTSDLRLTGLQLPYKPHKFDITGGKINIKGEVNENFMKMLYRYPQMPIGDYATSWIDADLREDIVNQIRSQLAGMSKKEAIQTLLDFFHDKNGIDYASDQVQHGFEKPYFLEENLYYPLNDCEDRAIFFSYLVWNALNTPCELIKYEGHESAAVLLDERVPGGYTYYNDGLNFTSADPTYLGAPIGSVMKRYRGVTNPQVDQVYK